MEDRPCNESSAAPDSVNQSAATKRENEEAREKKWALAYAARMREIVPGLILGNVEASYNREMLQENRITAIVSLTNARFVWWNSTTRKFVAEGHHKWVQCADSSTQDLLVHLEDVMDFIESVASPALRSSSALPSNSASADKTTTEAVLVHCDLGISRSPSVIVAYLMRKYHARLDDVLQFVQQKQRIKPSPNLLGQLRVWEQVRYQVWEDEERTVPKAPYQAFLDDRAARLKRKGLRGDEPLAPLSL